MIGIITSAISWKQTILFLGLPHSSWGSGPGCGRSSSGMAVRLRPHGSWPCAWFPVALFGRHFTRQCRGKMWIKHGPAKSFSDPQLRNVSKRINMQCVTSSNSPGSPPPWSFKMTPEFPPAPPWVPTRPTAWWSVCAECVWCMACSVGFSNNASRSKGLGCGEWTASTWSPGSSISTIFLLRTFFC